MTVIICVLLIALGIALYDYYDSREWQQVTSVERNNIVFQERNKKYGAYSMRRDYNDLVMLILVCVFAAVGIFKIINSTFIDKTVVAVVPVYDTIAMTLEAPPVQEIKSVKTPYKIEGGGGSGTPSNAPIDKPKPMVDKQNTIKESSTSVNSGQGNRTNSNNRTNTASSSNPSPFSGTGGSGGGNQGGRGRGLGDDTGNGTGPGPDGNGQGENDTKRVLIKKPNTNNIQSDEACKIVLTVTVDAEGDVISAKDNRSKTNTSNTALINQVIALIKREAKYTSRAGARNWTTEITVNVKAQ